MDEPSTTESTEEWSASTSGQGDSSGDNVEEPKPRPQKGAHERGTALVSSFEVFMSYVQHPDDEASVRVDRVFSEPCFSRWLKTRTKKPKEPEESFRRALTSHVRGTDQRKPFPEHVETALLLILRQKRSWDCFENLGRYGFRGRGFHENRRRKERKRLRKERKRARREEASHDPRDTVIDYSHYTTTFRYHHEGKRMRPYHMPPYAAPIPPPHAVPQKPQMVPPNGLPTAHYPVYRPFQMRGGMYGLQPRGEVRVGNEWVDPRYYDISSYDAQKRW